MSTFLEIPTTKEGGPNSEPIAHVTYPGDLVSGDTGGMAHLLYCAISEKAKAVNLARIYHPD